MASLARIAPLVAGTTMGVGSGAGSFAMSDAKLAYTTAASYVFGATNAGDLTINTGYDFGTKNVTFISGQDIILAGTLTKASGAGTATYLFDANRNIYNSSSAGISAGRMTRRKVCARLAPRLTAVCTVASP